MANAGRTTSQPQCSQATGALRFDEPNENVRQRSANERRSVSESVDNPVVAGANGTALPAHQHGKNANSRLLLPARILTGTFLIVEVIGSFVFTRLALLSEAGHMLTDVAALTIALMAITSAENTSEPTKLTPNTTQLRT